MSDDIKNINVTSSMGNNIKLGFGFGCGCLILIIVVFFIVPMSCTTAALATHRKSSEVKNTSQESTTPVILRKDRNLQTTATVSTPCPTIRSAAELLMMQPQNVTTESIQLSLATDEFKSKSEDELYELLKKHTVTANDEKLIKSCIAAAIENNYTTLTQKLSNSTWMSWYQNEIEIDALVPPPCNLSDICTSDQVTLLANYMYYTRAFNEAKTDVQRKVLSQQCLTIIDPYLQNDAVDWVGRVWVDVGLGPKGDDSGYSDQHGSRRKTFYHTNMKKYDIQVKPAVGLNPDGKTGNIAITISGLAASGQNKTMIYKGTDGKRHKMPENGDPIILFDSCVQESMFVELSKVDKPGQLIKFSGSFLTQPVNQVIWCAGEDPRNPLDPPIMFFKFTKIQVIKENEK